MSGKTAQEMLKEFSSNKWFIGEYFILRSKSYAFLCKLHIEFLKDGKYYLFATVSYDDFVEIDEREQYYSFPQGSKMLDTFPLYPLFKRSRKVHLTGMVFVSNYVGFRGEQAELCLTNLYRNGRILIPKFKERTILDTQDEQDYDVCMRASPQSLSFPFELPEYELQH